MVACGQGGSLAYILLERVGLNASNIVLNGFKTVVWVFSFSSFVLNFVFFEKNVFRFLSIF